MNNKGRILKINWQARKSAEKLALRLVKSLQTAGYPTYVVGGYVRDLVLKRKDTGAIDLATAATPRQVTRLLEKKKYRVIPTGLKHGTVTVHRGQDDIEITTFRTEGKYLDARHPQRVRFIADPAIDAGRRDFTINALYFDPAKKEIVDFTGGIEDLKKRRLRFVGSANQRIQEDALRLMRAVRFAAVLDFKLSSADQTTIKKNAKLISKISPERVKQELDKIMLSSRRSRGLDLLLKLGLLQHIAPQLQKLKATPQSKNFHSEGNVWAHTLLALSLVEPDADLRTLYGLLFHDIGKAVTIKRTRKEGRTHTSFHNHPEKGREITVAVLRRLRFSNSEIEDIAWYVKNHLVPFELPKMRVAKQMAWCLDTRFENLLKICRADTLAAIPTDKQGRKMKPSLAGYRKALKIYGASKKQKSLAKPLINGEDVMKILKIRPGPEVGKVLAEVRELQLEGKLASKKDAIAYLRRGPTFAISSR